MSIQVVVGRVLRAAGLGDLQVDIATVTDDEMQALNRRFRAVDAPTDVLSFPAHEGEEMPGLERELGALVIALPTARRQAAAFGHSLDEELAVLLVHGVLHLLGFDHEAGPREARRMAEHEMTILAAAGVEPTLALTGRALRA